ncbi:MAG: HAMP domain-containing histidine kinase [Prevotellaceae bacterium]|jgi:signal transduction histidine kinase|nr:HAMP domain-containing histidine kinase [Prevotellaceae bacterium]
MNSIIKYLFYNKFFVIAFAAVIASYSIIVSQQFVNEVAEEERIKVELWADAMKVLAQAEFASGIDFEFIHKVVSSNTSVPCILVSEEGNLLSIKNITSSRVDTENKLKAQIRRMAEAHPPIQIVFPDGDVTLMYYDDSDVQNILKNFPYVQLSAITLLMALLYLVISTAKKSEQNMLWVGMTKETAHQLGTPITSMLGWLTLLKEKGGDGEIAQELEKDVVRLQKISTKFSQIGVKENLHSVDIVQSARSCLDYMRQRASKNVIMVDDTCGLSANAKVNPMLWEWVVENLIKNALDAIGASHGTVKILAQKTEKRVVLDVQDSGRGISSKKLHKKIFTPGYTTKTRGWGVGLSFCKRVVEDLYHGKIAVLHSEVNKGTTIRVIMKAS